MHKTFIQSLVILLAGALLANAEAQNVVIDLPSAYTVPNADRKQIRLGDLANSITAPDENTKKNFESLVVLQSPEPGESERLPNHYIMQSIRKARLPFANVRFTGERLVEIFGNGRSLDLQTIIQKIRDRVLEESGWKEEEMILRILGAPKEELWIPPEKVEIVIDRTSPQLYGTVRFEVQLFIDSVLLKNFPLVASIAHRRVAYMPTQTLKRGDVFAPSDLREVVQYFDNEMLDKQAVDDPREIVGSKCRVALKKGDIIKWNNLDVNYVVNRGDKVKLIVISDGMTMQTTGKALKRGAVGDVVTIKAEPTEYVVKARVIQRGVVELISS